MRSRSKPLDWSGSWPTLTFPGGFKTYFLHKLGIGLVVLFALLCVMVVAAGERSSNLMAITGGITSLIGLGAGWAGVFGTHHSENIRIRD